MRTITYEKPFLDHTLKRVFVRSEDFNVDNNVKDSMTNDIERATKSICVVFDNFLRQLKDRLVTSLLKMGAFSNWSSNFLGF